ncbi:hypothetical protein LCGC14_1031280, partial [marine sediment metagenome]
MFLVFGQSEPETVVVTERVVKEVLVEVIVEVPVEVIEEIVVEVPVTPANCPPSSEVDWLVWSLEDARAMHLA